MFINQYNKFTAGEGKSLIRKALDSAAAVGQALVPEKLEKVITNTLVRLSPELAMVEPEFDNQKFHEFNRLTALPNIGGAIGEGATTPTRNSTYARATVQMKVIRRKGAVTNFLQDASAKYIDASATEMENHLLAHSHDMCNYMVWGNADANPFEYSGLDTFVTTNRIREVAAGVAIASLSTLDEMIDRNLDRQGNGHRKAFMMSNRMLSRISQLLTNVRLNQGVIGSGLTQVDVNGGWRLAAYRDIPIIATSSMRPTSTMGVVATATAAVGGTIPDDEYFVRVAAVTKDGEQTASAEVSQVTAGGGTSTLTLSWAANTEAYRYKIYVGLVAGTTPLRHVIPGFTYDANGTPTVSTTYTVNGKTVTSDANGNVIQVVFTTNPSTAGAEVPTVLQADVPLVGAGGVPAETIALWDLDKYQGLGKLAYTNTGGSKFNGLATVEPLARTDDDLPFLVKSYAALVPAFEATSVIHRGLRIA